MLVVTFCSMQPFLHAAKPFQLVPNFFVMCHQFVRCHTVAAFQTADQVEPFQNLLVAFRVEIFFFQQVTELETDFFDFILNVFQSRSQRFKFLVQITDLVHGFGCLTEFYDGTFFPASVINLFIGRMQGTVDFFRAQIALPFGGKFVRFPHRQLRCVQFFHPALQIFLTFVSLGVFFAQRGKPAAAFPPDLVGPRHFALFLLKSRVAEGVQKTHVIFSVQQALVLVLPMHVHQQFGKPAQESKRDNGSADAADISFAGDLPLDSQQPMIIGKLLFGQNLPRTRTIGNVDQRFHRCLFTAGADQAAVGTLAQHQIDAVHQNGLARACFTA